MITISKIESSSSKGIKDIAKHMDGLKIETCIYSEKVFYQTFAKNTVL